MGISNNGKYWIVKDPVGNEIARFKSLKELVNYVSITRIIEESNR